MKKICILNLPTGNCKNGIYVGSITDDSVITCDEIIETTKTVLTKFNKKGNLQNKNVLYFTWLFINYYSINNSCWYSLLPDKILSKIKAFITI